MKTEWITASDSNELEVKHKDQLLYLSFPALEATGIVKHAFSTRIGGVSQGKFSTLNFTFTRGDNPEHVMENYRRMADAIEVDLKRMVLSWQTHTTNVRRITEEDAGKGILRERDYQDVDGMITDVPGITLVTFYADCVPLYLVDPVHKAIGLSHSGWRGTAGRMGKITIDAMTQAYGSKPEDMIAAIGPSICQSCYEIGEETAVEFKENFKKDQWDEILAPGSRPDKYQLNLWKANEIIFREAGVRTEHIHTTNLCTRCNSDLLFSHRKAGNERGNLAAFLCLA